MGNMFTNETIDQSDQGVIELYVVQLLYGILDKEL